LYCSLVKKDELEVIEETTTEETVTAKTDTATSSFVLTSLAIENNELLTAFKCEEKPMIPKILFR
jgi:hypothetical protein